MLQKAKINNTTNYKSNWIYLLFLLLIVWIAYWPISFHFLSLKNDALNYFLPVRKLVSESYYNGILPLWTPYLNLGYPLHGDMQSGVWNPIVKIISLFGPYSLYTLQLETILYIYLSGAGMFFLLKYFKVHPLANVFASVAYMLCGFNSDSAQFLNWITAACCLPFLFLFYYRLLKENKIKWALATSIVLYIFFTSAYPADFILALYLMIGLFIWTFFQLRKTQPKWIINKRTLTTHAFLIITFILLSLPAIISYFQSLPLTERGSGADFDQVMSNPIHPFLLSSYTTPLGIWKMPGVNSTDPLERNSFIGIVGFVFLITSFLIKSKEPFTKFLKWATLVFLLFSFGELGGLRVLAYYILPLMNTFRHPANAKIFTTFFSVILIAFTFHKFIVDEINLKKLKLSIIIVTGFMLLIWLLSLFTPFYIFSFQNTIFTSGNNGIIAEVKEVFDRLSFADIVLINTVIQMIFLHFIWKYIVKKKNVNLILSLGVLNSLLFTILFQPFTVVKTKKAVDIQTLINENSVSGYPIPNYEASLNTISKGNEMYFDDIGCLALYNKKPGRSDYRITPSNLLNQNNFWFNEEFRNVIMNYPLIYRADVISDTNRFRQAINDSTNYWVFSNKNTEIKWWDFDSSANIRISKFTPNNFEATITVRKESFFVLLQNYYPRWKLYIDNKKANIEVVNISFMGFKIPSGAHHISFRYESSDLKRYLLISLFTLLSMILLLIVSPKKLV